MHDPSPSASTGLIRFRLAAFVVFGSLAVAIAWYLWTIGVFSPKTSATSLGVRSTYADSPYQNARPGVAYVGDAACTQCHAEIADAYRSHPMGRSLAPLIDVGNGPPTTRAAGIPFDSQGLHYTVERRDGRTFHKATRREVAGAVLGEIESEVRFALGSGTRGIAYLIERDGFLFQSPIAWYAQKARWDISPGYGEVNPRPNFERTIQTECLFCHTNQVRAIAASLNRYEPPIFEGHAIGCERCHGPGELHANRPSQSAGQDFNIVNPAKLAATLRDSVCQQCHLQGWFRFPRAGQDFFDFRPGLPIHRFLAVFVRTKDHRGKFDLIGQVEQMETSRCFRESQGELGCISCHDPHRLPEPSAKIAYYRTRCLECHDKKGCALPLAERRSRGQGDDCIACHMPRAAVTTIPHLAGTDHRIPRGTPVIVPDSHRDAAAPGLPPELLPRDYHWGLMTADERRDARRDMGVALESVARLVSGSPRLAKVAASRALPLLSAAVRDNPDDLPAQGSLGYALEVLDRPDDALRAYELILDRQPGRELTLHSSARVLARAKRLELARSAVLRTIAINPWRSDYRLALANICSRVSDWPAAIAACREALSLNPELFEARSLLIQCYLGSNQPDKADAEFQILLRFYPASRDVWEQWYKEQKVVRTASRKPGAATAPGDGP